MSSYEDVLSRQADVAAGTASRPDLPVSDNYAICNLRGGIGKTSLAFNLTYLADDVLSVDTCPQCNLSYFYDHNYYNSMAPTVYEMVMPHIIPGLGTPARVARKISATNQYFIGRNSFFISSSPNLYVLPSQLATTVMQASQLPAQQSQQSLDSIFYSLKNEIKREMAETGTKKCLIDTSPFFSGGTHLVWHASDTLIVPVRTDQQSINSLNLLISLLTQPGSEFRRIMPSDKHTPKIQLIVLTHCGWSTRSGAKNQPNQQTKMYVSKVYDIISSNITNFTTSDPQNHIVLLDDFLGSGRISSAQSKPIDLLVKGETMSINRTKVEVNQSVDKIKAQLRFMSSCLWG